MLRTIPVFEDILRTVPAEVGHKLLQCEVSEGALLDKPSPGSSGTTGGKGTSSQAAAKEAIADALSDEALKRPRSATDLNAVATERSLHRTSSLKVDGAGKPDSKGARAPHAQRVLDKQLQKWISYAQILSTELADRERRLRERSDEHARTRRMLHKIRQSLRKSQNAGGDLAEIFRQLGGEEHMDSSGTCSKSFDDSGRRTMDSKGSDETSSGGTLPSEGDTGVRSGEKRRSSGGGRGNQRGSQDGATASPLAPGARAGSCQNGDGTEATASTAAADEDPSPFRNSANIRQSTSTIGSAHSQNFQSGNTGSAELSNQFASSHPSRGSHRRVSFRAFNRAAPKPVASGPAGLELLLVHTLGAGAEDANEMAAACVQCGYSVATASSGEAAIQRVRRGDHFDLVLLDEHLPDGMTAVETLHALRREARKETAVVIAADAFGSSIVESCILEGADSFVTKPLVDKEAATMWTFVARRQQQANEAASQAADLDQAIRELEDEVEPVSSPFRGRDSGMARAKELKKHHFDAELQADVFEVRQRLLSTMESSWAGIGRSKVSRESEEEKGTPAASPPPGTMGKEALQKQAIPAEPAPVLCDPALLAAIDGCVKSICAAIDPLPAFDPSKQDPSDDGGRLSGISMPDEAAYRGAVLAGAAAALGGDDSHGTDSEPSPSRARANTVTEATFAANVAIPPEKRPSSWSQAGDPGATTQPRQFPGRGGRRPSRPYLAMVGLTFSTAAPQKPKNRMGLVARLRRSILGSTPGRVSPLSPSDPTGDVMDGGGSTSSASVSPGKQLLPPITPPPQQVSPRDGQQPVPSGAPHRQAPAVPGTGQEWDRAVEKLEQQLDNEGENRQQPSISAVKPFAHLFESNESGISPMPARRGSLDPLEDVGDRLNRPDSPDTSNLRLSAGAPRTRRRSQSHDDVGRFSRHGSDSRGPASFKDPSKHGSTSIRKDNMFDLRNSEWVLCRLCEAPVVKSELEAHTQFCAASIKAQAADALTTKELADLLKSVHKLKSEALQTLVTIAVQRHQMLCSPLGRMQILMQEALGLEKQSVSPLHHLGRLTEVLRELMKLRRSEAHAIRGAVAEVTGSVFHSCASQLKALLAQKIAHAQAAIQLDSRDPSTYNRSTPALKNTTIHDFSLLRVIGTGGFAAVWLARKKTTGDVYAVKAIRKEVIRDQAQVASVNVEHAILEKHSCDFLVRCFFSFRSAKHIYFVLEYMPGGDLSTMLDNCGILEEPTASFYVAEMILGVEYLHRQRILHRDIKPSNVLIASTGHIKLTDFGLSSSTARDKQCGTLPYVAPEVLQGATANQTNALDHWSIGVVLYQLITGMLPFPMVSNRLEMLKGIENTDPEAWDVGISAPARSVVRGLLVQNQLERLGRLGVREIKTHAFFRGTPWDEMSSQQPPFVPDLTGDDDVSYFEGGVDLNVDDMLDAESEADSESNSFSRIHGLGVDHLLQLTRRVSLTGAREDAAAAATAVAAVDAAKHSPRPPEQPPHQIVTTRRVSQDDGSMWRDAAAAVAAHESDHDEAHCAVFR